MTVDVLGPTDCQAVGTSPTRVCIITHIEGAEKALQDTVGLGLVMSAPGASDKTARETLPVLLQHLLCFSPSFKSRFLSLPPQLTPLPPQPINEDPEVQDKACIPQLRSGGVWTAPSAWLKTHTPNC